ncbi:hypothetical protein C4J81_05285 [Deltaproteobacteria bacterium Smac51]|nr:hypothetical protein C4J81_05285 [Deltaproteobacteria bacterium Smac51]
MILRRIYLSFALMGLISLALGVIGWISTRNSGNALTGVIENDLPAAEQMGALGREIMSIQANLNTRLNPNLNLDEREIPHREFEINRKELLEAINKFDVFTRNNADNQMLAQVSAEWGKLKTTQGEWLKMTDEIFAKYSQWDATFVLNPNALLRDLQQYRGDHYFLVRRMVEMETNRQVSGAEVGSDDTLCAFGQWRKRFESGEDVLSRNQVFQKAMEAMREPHKDFHAHAAEMYSLIRDNPYSHRVKELSKQVLVDADAVVSTFGMMIEEANRAMAAYQEAMTMVQHDLRPKRDQMMETLQALIDAKAVYDVSFKEDMLKSGQRSQTIMMIVVGVALVLSALLAIFMVSNIKKNLRGIIGSLTDDAERLSTMSGSMSDTSSALSAGSSEQAASLEECSAAIEEMNSMTQRNSEHAKQVNELMAENNRQVSEGSHAVERMDSAMGDIKNASEEIGRIMKTIEDIAFQTNILALNASVEAARAGEAGAGFSVVADEVRNLAQRTAQASQDTNKLIENTIQKVGIGLSTTRDIQERFVSLTQSTQDSAQMVHQIDEATSEQAQGMEQLNTSITQIDQVTQSNAANANTAANASSELNQRADHLLHQVEKLAEVIGGVDDVVHHTGAAQSSPLKSLPME